MNLPPELFQATISALQATAGAGSSDAQHEGRTTPRRRLVGSATIIPCSARSGRVPKIVGVCDLSPEGIAIVHTSPFRVGDEFILAIPATATDVRRAALFTVVHWQPQSDGTYRVGASFTRELRPSAADEGRCEPLPAKVPPQSHPLEVGPLSSAFRTQAASGLTPAEQEQLRDLESRLANALKN